MNLSILCSVIGNGFLHTEFAIIWNIIEFAENESVFLILATVGDRHRTTA
jgi:hypothetical protein